MIARDQLRSRGGTQSRLKQGTDKAASKRRGGNDSGRKGEKKKSHTENLYKAGRMFLEEKKSTFNIKS